MALAALAVAGCDSGEDEPAATEPSTPPASVQLAEVGDPPTNPPAPVEGMDLRAPRPTVIAAGTTARGEPFELVLQGTSKGPCMLMTFPASESEGGGGCGEDLFLDLSGPIQSTGSATNGKGRQVAGIVSRAVDSVELSYERDGKTHVFPATTEQISPKLLEAVGEKEPVGIFVAFLPHGVGLGEVTATALDANGTALGTTRWADL